MNTSKLISDGFVIFSQAYSKIGTLAVEVVDLTGKPRQPKKINQLIECAFLFSLIESSIILNDDGDAIAWVHGDVEVINNLLLKLKRACRLYDYNVFVTPLTSIVFSNSCDCDGGGECDDVEQVDTTGATITLPMGVECAKLFLGSADIDGGRVWSITGGSEAKEFTFNFTITGLAAMGDSTHDQTLPSTIKMADARIVPGSPKKWRPYENGEYEARARTYNNGASWIMEIFGPVT